MLYRFVRSVEYLQVSSSHNILLDDGNFPEVFLAISSFSPLTIICVKNNAKESHVTYYYLSCCIEEGDVGLWSLA